MTFNIEVIIFHFQILFKFKDRKSTRLNSSHLGISYAVFCLKKKKNKSQLQSLKRVLDALLLRKRKMRRRVTVRCREPPRSSRRDHADTRALLRDPSLLAGQR